MNRHPTVSMDHFGAIRYNRYATPPKITFGSQAAIKGGKSPLVEKTVDKRSQRIKTTAMMMPMARCKPLPPLILRLETTTPIKVNNNTVNGVAVRRYNSTRKVFRPSE